MNRRQFINKVTEYVEDKWAADFSRHGYTFKMNVGLDEFPLIKLTTDNEEMPDINVATVKFGDHGQECYQFECNLRFPDIEFNSDYDYEDHTHYVISSLWEPLGRTITNFQKWILCWDDFEEEQFS